MVVYVTSERMAIMITSSGSRLADKDRQQYLAQLALALPHEFFSEIHSVMATLPEIKTPAAALQIAPLIQLAYQPFNEQGEILHAREIHDQLQMLLQRFHQEKALAIDKRKYTESVSDKILDHLLKQFNDAMQANDRHTAKQKLDELNAAAPEAGQAMHARTSWSSNNTTPAATQ